MKVLVGIDGSELSYHALQFVSRLVSPKCDNLVLYFSPPAFRLSSKSSVPKDILKDAAGALAKAVFDRALGYLSAELQEVTETIRGEKKPADGILAAADNEDIDLIVLGAHGAVRTLTLFLGGTARHVAHHSPKPVLLVRGEQELPTVNMRVLIACDEQRWRDAARALRDFSWPENTKATMFHVVEALDETHVKTMLETGGAQLVREYQDHLEETKADCETEIKTSREGLPTIVTEADVEVAQGQAVDLIVAKADRDKADLVVVGSRKLGPVARLLGSTTEALMIRCPCSLLIVHEHAKV